MAIDWTTLYKTTLGRAPDAAGLDYWQGLQKAGTSDEALRAAFYNGAAKEVQRDDTGLSANLDAYDEARIRNAMTLYNDQMPSSGGYWANAGDTANMSAAQRLGPQAWQALAQQSSPPPAPQPQPLSNPSQYTPNPYLPQMADSIRTQMTDNLQRNVLPNIGSAAVAAGGYGGSRQGVLEANALKDMNQGLSNSLAGLYYGDYNNAMQRQLQQYGMDQNYNLGLGNLALGNQNSLQNFYSTQRGQDMQQMQLGANLFQMGNQGMLGQGQFLYNLGLTQQQAPWQVMGNYTNTLSPFTGYGSTSGNPFAGAIGGALTGAQLYNIFRGN